LRWLDGDQGLMAVPVTIALQLGYASNKAVIASFVHFLQLLQLLFPILVPKVDETSHAHLRRMHALHAPKE